MPSLPNLMSIPSSLPLLVLVLLLALGMLVLGFVIERQPEPWQHGRRFVILSEIGLLWSLWFFIVAVPATPGGAAYDIVSYWTVNLDDPYARSFGAMDQLGSFRYSPVFAFLMAPLHALPFDVVVYAFTILFFVTLVWLAGRYSLAALAFPAVVLSIDQGNIDLLIAASIVLGMRYPAAWAFGILAKLTPGVGLLWFAARREWRSLAIALGATVAIALPTVVARPDLWQGWIASLTQDNVSVASYGGFSLPLRLAIAAVLIVFAARTDRPWILGIAIALSQPGAVLRILAVAVSSIYLATHRGSVLATHTGYSARRGRPPSAAGTVNAAGPIHDGRELPSRTGASAGT